MTVLSEIGPVEIEVPFGPDGTLTPVIAPQRKRRLDGIDQIVLHVLGQRIDHGEIAAHFEEVYGAKVSKDTISRITEKVAGELAEWSSRPLDPLYPVLFVDVIAGVDPRQADAHHALLRRPGRDHPRGTRQPRELGRRRRARAPGSGCRSPLQLKTRGVQDTLTGSRRRAQGPAGGHHDHRATDGGAAVRRAPDPQLLPLRQPPAPRRDRHGAQTRRHRLVRGRGGRPVPFRSRPSRPAVSGDRAAVGAPERQFVPFEGGRRGDPPP